MSTCSTATSALRSPERRRRRRDAGHLETRLRDLERDWDAYKTGRSSAPRHRRSRSATTATTSSAVTAAAPDDLCALLRCSPRRLVYSLQQDDSGGTDNSDGAITVVKRGRPDQCRRHEDAASSVCSVEAGYSISSASSCSRPCECAVLCCGGYTTSPAASEPPFSPAAGHVTVSEDARKTDDRSRMMGGRVGWFAAIAVVAVGTVVALAAVMELGIDEDSTEFLVPT